MATELTNTRYYIWGIDQAAYGPVGLETLVEWIQDERVLATTWVFSQAEDDWKLAKNLKELQAHFSRSVVAPVVTAAAPGARPKPGSLRRIKILAELSDQQLAHLAEFLDPLTVPQWKAVFNQGDAGDALYMILGGELRARVVVNEKETILSTFEVGEFFGDMALFDHGTRSADVVANTESILLKLSSVNFERMVKEAPALATPFLQAAVRTMAARIRADNKRFARLTQQFSAGNS